MSEARLSAAEFLRSLAQNDYMVDQYFLPEGERLNALADALDNVLDSAAWRTEHQHVGDVAPSIALRFDLSLLKAV